MRTISKYFIGVLFLALAGVTFVEVVWAKDSCIECKNDHHSICKGECKEKFSEYKELQLCRKECLSSKCQTDCKPEARCSNCKKFAEAFCAKGCPDEDPAQSTKETAEIKKPCTTKCISDRCDRICSGAPPPKIDRLNLKKKSPAIPNQVAKPEAMQGK